MHDLHIILMEVTMKEKHIEQKLVLEAKSRGGICPKLISPGFDGMPDRMALLPNGKMGFVEVKAPGQKPRPLQLKRHAMLRRLGYQVFVLDAMEDIPAVLKAIAHMHDGKGGGGA